MGYVFLFSVLGLHSNGTSNCWFCSDSRKQLEDFLVLAPFIAVHSPGLQPKKKGLRLLVSHFAPLWHHSESLRLPSPSSSSSSSFHISRLYVSPTLPHTQGALFPSPLPLPPSIYLSSPLVTYVGHIGLAHARAAVICTVTQLIPAIAVVLDGNLALCGVIRS
jgi:hypothetical protein